MSSSGLSGARLARMHEVMTGHVDRGEVPGIVTKAVSGFLPGYSDNRGWGFGVSIVTRRDDLAAVPGRYGWDGGYGTSWSIGPERGAWSRS